MHTVQQKLRTLASPERKKQNEYFFKTGKAGYAEHDIFIGVRLPDIRKVAKEFTESTFQNIKGLLASKIHEERLCALIILVNQYKHSDVVQRKKISDFYLQNKKHINNWDLVDVSAHYILGQYILDNPTERGILKTLALSKSLWDRRIAMVSTWIMIRAGNISETLFLAKILLKDKEDLMHKAVGWMLREAWKKEPEQVENFLKEYYQDVPRTTLRYAIERMEEGKRKRFLKGKW
jgi:3-methyladenine DNA glycosylase AlkD